MIPLITALLALGTASHTCLAVRDLSEEDIRNILRTRDESTVVAILRDPEVEAMGRQPEDIVNGRINDGSLNANGMQTLLNLYGNEHPYEIVE